MKDELIKEMRLVCCDEKQCSDSYYQQFIDICKESFKNCPYNPCCLLCDKKEVVMKDELIEKHNPTYKLNLIEQIKIKHPGPGLTNDEIISITELCKAHYMELLKNPSYIMTDENGTKYIEVEDIKKAFK